MRRTIWTLRSVEPDPSPATSTVERIMIEDLLLALPEHRRDAVAAWLSTSIGVCAVCARPILATDPHKTADAGFQHLNCHATDIPPPTPAEPVSKNAEANARRTDWG